VSQLGEQAAGQFDGFGFVGVVDRHDDVAVAGQSGQSPVPTPRSGLGPRPLPADFFHRGRQQARRQIDVHRTDEHTAGQYDHSSPMFGHLPP
jgi:hypothetical protein